jgi:hypothetical protein
MSRVADAARSLATAATAGGRGAWRTARRGARGAGLGLRRLLRRRGGAGALLSLGVARLLLQVPADALLLALARLVSALQTLLLLEPPGRPLDDGERSLLVHVFGDGIDPRPVRLKVGRLGLLGVPRRAFVVGDTVHVPGLLDGDLAARVPALLVHELAHVWQHQRHGTRYLSECLLAQWVGEGYNVAVAVEAGRGWGELSFEQQAELLERAFAAGWFEGEADGRRRLLVELTDATRDDGYRVRLVTAEEAPLLIEGGWRDATPVLSAGLAAVRRAPRSKR